MTINLEPEDEKLIEKRLRSGLFGSPREVIRRALESLDAEESWLHANKEAINEKIDRGMAQFERGEGLTAEDSLALLEGRKAAWRAEQRRG
jgi:putative addiction module CopG family antidote